MVFIAGPGDGSHIFPIIIRLENVFHDLIGLFIDHKSLSFSYGLVSKGRRGLIALPQSLLRHAADHLSGQVVGVVLVKPFNDGLDQPPEHPFHDRLRDAFDLHAAFLPENPLVKG